MERSVPGATQYSEADIRWKLRQLANKHGSQKKLAQHLGISEQFLSDILHERRAVPAPLAARLGYRRVLRYIKGGI